ncbi:MAG: hypothetical protein IPP34_04585 [Bacteroidetes bacterium]|nr:hypothetical protein [Bacteroidota bacterium]
MSNTISFIVRCCLAILFCCCFSWTDVIAQGKTQVEIDNADTFEGDESLGKNVSRLLGNVRFRHQGALMYCDSAYLYQETNSLDAFGNIRILQGDSVQLTGNFLQYDGNSRQAKLTGKVTMTDRQMILTSDVLNYNLGTETADYTDGGKITDRENVLTSRKGYYFSKEKMLYFRDDVVLTNPKYKVNADTLKYNTLSKTAIFAGPTTINSTGTDSSRIYCESGWYNTATEQSLFTNNAVVISKENKLSGDSLLYNNKEATGRGYGNVTIADSIQKSLFPVITVLMMIKPRLLLLQAKLCLLKHLKRIHFFYMPILYMQNRILLGYRVNGLLTKGFEYLKPICRVSAIHCCIILLILLCPCIMSRFYGVRKISLQLIL